MKWLVRPLVLTVALGAGLGCAALAQGTIPPNQGAGVSGSKRWGEWITCGKGTTECEVSRSLLACTYDRAVRLAEEPRVRDLTVPLRQDCAEVLYPGRTFEIETTNHPKVIYAKNGTEHIGYVPITFTLDSVRSQEFPAELRGVWLSSEANCQQYLRDKVNHGLDEFMEIKGSEINYWESSGKLLSLHPQGRGTWQLDLHFNGEGVEWLDLQTLQRVGNTLRVPHGQTTEERILCTGGQPVRSSARGPKHSDFPARPYRGPIAMPDFHGRDRAHRAYRTRISEGARRGPNAAGHLAIIPIGCGTRCLFFPVVDVLTGRVSSFPIGGEEYPSIDLDYRINSNLVIATWEENPERCMRASYLWTGRVFRQASGLEVISNDGCPP